MNNYNPKTIEEKWQKKWEEAGLYKTKDFSEKEKFYCLDMFPYPSGDGLHVGHPKGYIATDVISRFKMLQGKEVLHPMGWDAFGLPAENYAIKNKVHPSYAVSKNVKRFKKQLGKIGFTYDWTREINTTDPAYYKWTQWIFLQMFKKGLAYESFEPINWCPSCKTGLANEDLENGKCERCDTEIERKPMRQWVLKMTAYADRLLEGLKNLDWEKEIIDQQKNWIGRSEGATVRFKVKSLKSKANYKLEVFTTRPDTLFGCTYMVVCPEHSLISEFQSEISNMTEIEKYIKETRKKSDLERTDLAKEKTGVEIKGIKAINPVNNEKIPIFVADYVLAGYGTGAIMAVPAHDERDFEFAKKFGIAIKKVIAPESLQMHYHNPNSLAMGAKNSVNIEVACFCGEGININSEFLNGLKTKKAKEKIIEWLSEKGAGEKSVNYKMRDWVFSRQRYWGEPIPLIHCEKCGVVGVPEEELPVKLPDVENYEPTGTGESPLAGIDDWVNTKCPKCGQDAKRETNTMPQWAGSCWYYLRYIDPNNDKALIAIEKEKTWMPVDLYVGGAEHATRHLLYARFWHKFLYDIGAVSTQEPFKKLLHVGLILAEGGKKMSKRYGNVINPDDMIEKFGADSLRLYEMFMGPFNQPVAWSTDGLKGVKKFLDKVWALQGKIENKKNANDDDVETRFIASKNSDKIKSLLHKTIKKVSEDIENFKFNTAISAMMILAREMEKMKEIDIEDYKLLLLILAPFAPHICEELWEKITSPNPSLSRRGTNPPPLQGGARGGNFIFYQSWPAYDPKLAKDETIELVVQINGKLRDRVEATADISEEDAKKLIMEREKVKEFIEGKEIVKIIFIKGKLVNIVVR